jgi:quercetin dioxygenase-like cupin family protein
MGSRTRLAAALAVLAVTVAALAGLTDGGSATSAPGAPEAKRDAMAQTARVQGAPQRELVLSRVVVPPGAKLALHHHLGTQGARIESGVLTYTVEQGSVVVRRGQSDADPVIVRTIDAGTTGKIKAGEWIVEQPSDIHRATNKGPKPVVIYLATLLKAGAPPATPVSGT